jgi:uncharacterized protein YegL
MPSSRVRSESPWHVVFLIDDSGSMSGQPSQAVNQALKEMLAKFEMISQGKKPYFRISIVAFGTSINKLCEAVSEMNIDPARIATFDGDMGSTNAAAGFDAVCDLLVRNPGKSSDFIPFVFFFSDGAPDDEAAALAAAARVKSLDIAAGTPMVVSIGFGQSVAEDFMRSTASNPELFKWLKTPDEILRFLPEIGTSSQSATGGAQAVAQGIMNI